MSVHAHGSVKDSADFLISPLLKPSHFQVKQLQWISKVSPVSFQASETTDNKLSPFRAHSLPSLRLLKWTKQSGFDLEFPTFCANEKDIYTECLIYQRLVASRKQMATLHGSSWSGVHLGAWGTEIYSWICLTQSKLGRGSRAGVASSATCTAGVASPNSVFGPLDSTCFCFSLEWAVAGLLRCTGRGGWSWASLYGYVCYISIALLKPRGSPWVCTRAHCRQKN